MKETVSFIELCIGEFCFATPDSNELKNFSDAKSWCTDIGSALAVVNDSDTQLALTQFLMSSNMSAMMFINIKLNQQSIANTWFVVNGSNYIGSCCYKILLLNQIEKSVFALNRHKIQRFLKLSVRQTCMLYF